MIGNIARRWRTLSGQDNWNNLLEPLDIDLRRYLIHYGEMTQVAYDAFDSEKASKFAGCSKFSRKDLFDKIGLSKSNPLKYNPTKYIYATSQVKVPEGFILKSWSREAWCRESNWIAYVAVTTDEGKAEMGRRDILIAWRGTVQKLEWVDDFDFPLVSASEIFGAESYPMVHEGFLSIYTSDDPRSPNCITSARDQVLTEVKRLVQEFKDEEISISITGHSLGAALATLNAADIVVHGLNGTKDRPNNPCPVTAFVFACPHVGNSNFQKLLESKTNLHILRVRNEPDIVPDYPPLGYSAVGEELLIDTRKSNYLKSNGDLGSWHNLECYLHGVAGWQGRDGGFQFVVKRDIALVNKASDYLKDEYLVPASWWCMENKGMVQMDDGTWKLDDHEKDND